MGTERLAPDAILIQTNLSGVLGAIDEDPDSPDASFLTAIDDGDNTDLRVSFATPIAPPLPGIGLQEFRAWVRSTGGGLNPTARLEVWESGVSLAVGLDIPITSTSGQLISFLWNASVLTDSSGAGVECRMFGDSTGIIVVDPFDTVEVGAVEWNVMETQPVDYAIGFGGGSTTCVGSKQVIPACDYEAWTNSQNPIAYWRLGESAGPTAFDETGNHDGTYTGTPGFSQPGLISSDPDTSIDTTSGGVTVPYSSDFDNLTGFTVRVWVNMESLGVVSIVTFGDGVAMGWFLGSGQTLPPDPTVARAWRFVTADDTANGLTLAPVTRNETVQIVAVSDPPNNFLYINGALGGTGSVTIRALASPGTPLLINSSFDGLKDDPAFFNYAWTPEQVLEDYQAGTCGRIVNSGGGSNACQGVSAKNSEALNTGGGSQTTQGSAQFEASAINSGGGSQVSTGSTAKSSSTIQSGGGSQKNIGSSGSGSSDALIVCDVTCRTRWEVECKSQRWQVECKSC